MGYGCWRQFVLRTSLKCWCQLGDWFFPIQLFCEQYLEIVTIVKSKLELGYTNFKASASTKLFEYNEHVSMTHSIEQVTIAGNMNKTVKTILSWKNLKSEFE